MATKITTVNGVHNLSDVSTLKDIQHEIELLKVSIKNDETEIAEMLKIFPKQAAKSTAGAVLPSFINNMIANKTWKILISSAGLLINPFQRKKNVTKNIVGTAKKLGVIAIARSAFNIWANRKKQSKTTALKTPAVKVSTPVKTIIK